MEDHVAGPSSEKQPLQETDIIDADAADGVEVAPAMENASDWSSGIPPAALLGSGDGSATGGGVAGGGLVGLSGAFYKVGIYGWRKRCLYLFVLLLMIMVIVNMALLLWIVKVLDFSVNGMGKLRILDKGIRLEGEAEFVNSLYTTTVESRKDMPLKVESAQNVTLNARNQEGQIVNRLFIGDRRIESMAGRFVIKNPSGKVLFSADDDEVEVAADSLKVTGSGGAVFDGSVQTPLVVSEPGHQLRLESPTRSLEMSAPHGIALESMTGDIAATCLNDLKLQSTQGTITMDSETILLKNLPEAATSSQHSQPETRVYQLCACVNGRLFLAAPNGHCRGDTTICK